MRNGVRAAGTILSGDRLINLDLRVTAGPYAIHRGRQGPFQVEDADDGFELFDLRVEMIVPEGVPIYCGAKPGDHFELKGEMLTLPAGQGVSLYSLASVLPLLAAKQRPTHRNDWMTTDAEIACPDPNCGSRLRITRTGKRHFRHADTTAVPLPPNTGTV